MPLRRPLAPRLGVVVKHDRRRLLVRGVVARREGADVGDGRVRVHLVVHRGRERHAAEAEADVNPRGDVHQPRLPRIDRLEELRGGALLVKEDHVAEVAEDLAVGEAAPRALQLARHHRLRAVRRLRRRRAPLLAPRALD